MENCMQRSNPHVRPPLVGTTFLKGPRHLKNQHFLSKSPYLASLAVSQEPIKWFDGLLGQYNFHCPTPPPLHANPTLLLGPERDHYGVAPVVRKVVSAIGFPNTYPKDISIYSMDTSHLLGPDLGDRKLSYSSSQLKTPTLTSQRYFSSPISNQHN